MKIMLGNVQQEIKYNKTIKSKLQKMTCIIGGRCKDGVVMIADRKVTYINDPPRYREKIFSPYYPIVLAPAGYNDLIDKFVQKALEKAQEIHQESIPGSFAPIS